MATLVLGVAGAAIGSAVPGLGTAWGFSIGTMIGGMLDAASQPSQPVGKLNDLRVAGSAYGASIPMVWGSDRVAGNEIWSTDLVQHISSTGGGPSGMGGGGVQQYSYTVSCAVLVSETGKRHPTILRINADDVLWWDSTSGVTLASLGATFYANGFDPSIDPNTLVDPVMSAAIAALTAGEKTPAYLGWCYFVFSNLDLSIFGNRVPNFTFDVKTDDVSLGDYASDLCEMVGVVAGAAADGTQLSYATDFAGASASLTSGAGTGGTAGVQQLTVVAGGGTYTLSYKGQTTGNIAYNVASSAVQTALNGLSSIGTGGVSVAGTPDTGFAKYTITFTALLGTRPAITANGVNLTNGLTSASAQVVPVTLGLPMSDGEGVTINSRVQARDALVQVADACAYDLGSVDGVLRLIKRGGAPSFTIDAGDLGTTTARGSQAVILQESRAPESTLPYQIDLTYLSASRSFQQTTQTARMITALHYNLVSLNLPMVLGDDHAAQIAQRVLGEAWLAQRTFPSINLPFRYMTLAPGDVGWLPVKGVSTRIKVTKMGIGLFAELRLEGVFDDADVITQSVVSSGGGSATPLPSVPLASPTLFAVWSAGVKELSAADAMSAGFYVVATGGVGWSRGTVYYSKDGGSTWSLPAATVTQKSVFGLALSALSASGAVAGSVDASNAFNVVINDQSLDVATLAQIQSGTNQFVLGAEIGAFESRSLTSALHYTVSNSLRGLRTSVMNTHASGELFALTQNAVRVTVPPSLAGATLLVKVCAPGQSPTDSTIAAQSVVINNPVVDSDSVSVTIQPYTGSTENLLFVPVYSSHDLGGVPQSYQWQKCTDGVGTIWAGPDATANTWWTGATYSASFGGGHLMARVRGVSVGGVLGGWVPSSDTVFAAPSAGSTANFADNETVGGTKNGVNTTFTLAFSPSPAASLTLVWNGQVMRQGTDYSISGATITWLLTGDRIPQSGDTLFAWYRR